MRYLRQAISLAFVAIGILFAAPAGADHDASWPKRVDASGGTLIVYEPEYDRFSETELVGRAAIGWDAGGDAGPLFGALWFTASTETDREARVVEVLGARVTDWRFSAENPAEGPAVGSLVEAEIPRWGWRVGLDDLTRQLDLRERDRQAAEKLSSLPPKILFSTTPATLILIDGEPEWRPIENSRLLRVINTPALMVMDPASGRHYLNSGNDWMEAPGVQGPWEASPNPPAELAGLVKQGDDALAELPPGDPLLPKIIVATEPAELIVSDGEPRYKLFPGNELLYMSNTESDVLLDLASQRHHVLLSGRWYSGWSLDGPWTFVPADRLPASFQRIPADSPKGHLLNHVAGTQEAESALKDAEVPRITAVNRNDARLDVVYDGYPQFAPIEGTDMRYAVNTQTPVIEADGRYYAVDDGVWFVADRPEGPWYVADWVPDKIMALPPDSPVYHVKFVRVYHATPEVVYVGYTPGYLGSYVYHGTLVYGTGYHYTPWIGAYYYPWPLTWGFHALYDPWYGWGFGWSFLFWYSWGVHHHHHYHHHHHHIYTPHHLRPPAPSGALFHRSTRWWGPAGYRSFERKTGGFDSAIDTRRDYPRFKDGSRINRVFPAPRGESFQAPGAPGKPGRFDRNGRVAPGASPSPGKPRRPESKFRPLDKYDFSDRFNQHDRIRPDRDRETPPASGAEEGRPYQFSPRFTPPAGGRDVSPRGREPFSDAPKTPGTFKQRTPRQPPAGKPDVQPGSRGQPPFSSGGSPKAPGIFKQRTPPPAQAPNVRPAPRGQPSKPFSSGGSPKAPGTFKQRTPRQPPAQAPNVQPAPRGQPSKPFSSGGSPKAPGIFKQRTPPPAQAPNVRPAPRGKPPISSGGVSKAPGVFKQRTPRSPKMRAESAPQPSMRRAPSPSPAPSGPAFKNPGSGRGGGANWKFKPFGGGGRGKGHD